MAENTALVMGGHFQAEMVHFTKSHHELLRPESRPLFAQQYKIYRDAENFPSQERPRLVHPCQSVDPMSFGKLLTRSRVFILDLSSGADAALRPQAPGWLPVGPPGLLCSSRGAHRLCHASCRTTPRAAAADGWQSQHRRRHGGIRSTETCQVPDNDDGRQSQGQDCPTASS